MESPRLGSCTFALTYSSSHRRPLGLITYVLHFLIKNYFEEIQDFFDCFGKFCDEKSLRFFLKISRDVGKV